MSSINGFGDIMIDWDSLLAAYKHHAAILGDAEAERAFLEEARNKAYKLKFLQDSLRAQRQAATQELNDVVRQGKEAAIRLRSLARHRLGPRNEGLSLFRVAPIRRRKGRRAAAEEPEPRPE
jgi:hypothetical protein